MIQLSPSKLNLLKECPRCFWHANVKKIARPRGIFPSLPGGMDIVLKKYFNQFRGSLPPAIIGKVKGTLMSDNTTLNKWRNWKTGLEYYDNKNKIKLIGALDDCLIDEGMYIPLDYKTKGSRHENDGTKYYQLQLDCYMLMLEANGYKTAGIAYLVYFYPHEAKTGQGSGLLGFDFGVEVFELKCDLERAKETIEKAVSVINGPEPAVSCEYCDYVDLRKE